MKRLIIAVDCDDVLIRTTPFFINAYNRKYGTSVTLEQAHNVDDKKLWGVDKETLEGRLAELMETDEYKSLRPSREEGAILTELSKHHELHVITARRAHERELTQLMLDTYLPNVFTSLELVGFTGSKGEVCERIHADVLIDDNARHIEDAIQHGLPAQGGILFGDYPWNTQPDPSTGLTECHSWSDVEEEINNLARQ